MESGAKTLLTNTHPSNLNPHIIFVYLFTNYCKHITTISLPVRAVQA